MKMTNHWEDYNKSFLCDGIRFICGEMLGSGLNREVFVYNLDENFVVKSEINANSMFQNVIEYDFWQSVRNAPDMLKWIAPCVHISPHGNFLLQKRTMPVTLDELNKRVPKIPVYLTDSKVDNWGRLPNGKIVCHDYGTHVSIGCSSSRLKKAYW